MTWSKRSTRYALFGYVSIAGLTAVGLAWASIASLQLEHAELTTAAWRDHHNRLHLALSRLERRVLSTLIRETNRSVYEYAPAFYPSRVWDDRGAQLDPGTVMEVSPAVDREFEEWFLLHFQASPSRGWTSPQASVEELIHLEGLELPPVEASYRAGRVLEELSTAVGVGDLGAHVAAACARDQELALGRMSEAATTRGSGPTTPVRNGPRQAGRTGRSAAPQQQSEYALRQRQTLEALDTAQPGEACDPLGLAMRNLILARGERDSTADGAEQVPITPSPMTAVWLQLGEPPERALAYVRTVPVGGEYVYQGFLLDWALLSERLLAEIRDVLPEATLVPVESGPVEDRETLLTVMPAYLEVPFAPDAASAGWTPVRRSLALAWGAALVVLAAVGIGLRSFLALTERRAQFAYAVSHELRTPLTTFRLYTDMLAGGLVPEEHRGEYLKTLNVESERLTQLVASVLEYSRLEHHSVQLAATDTTVGELLEVIRERLAPRCATDNRRLVVEANGLADQRWRTDTDVAVQIVGTLVDNACKYARDAEDPRIIVSTARERDGYLAIEVRDFGPGISRRDRHRIFKPFRRGQKCATDQAGIGLGLALAHRWAKLLGGDLKLIQPGKRTAGACFRLAIPELQAATV